MFDTKKLILAALLSFVLLIVCLGVLILGTKVDVFAKQIGIESGIVAGPLSNGVWLEQELVVPENSAGEALHFGFRFATYSRKNLGQIHIQISQGNFVNEHSIRSSELIDNEIVYFSFPDIKSGHARLRMEGVNGPSHNSATVWCHSSVGLPFMSLNGELSDRRVDIWFAEKTINQEVLLRRVGMGGLVFLSLVFFAILTTLFYRGFVELDCFSVLRSLGSSVLAAMNPRRLWVSIPISLLSGGLVVLGFYLTEDKSVSFLPLNDQFSNERVPIAPLSKGVVVEQPFEVTSEMAGSGLGLGLSFGTFLRTNKAKIELKVTQGDKSDRVILNSKTLEDGVERIFVFSPLDAGEATLTISGINGKGSNSPTVWFDPDGEGPQAIVNGEQQPQQLMLFRYIVVPDTIDLKRESYRFKSTLTVMLLMFLLIQFLGRKKHMPF